MKYLILFLLLGSLCRAQVQKPNYDYTKVTAYRLVNADIQAEDKNAILQYMKRQNHVGYFIQAQQSTDQKMAYELLRLKNESANWLKNKPDSASTVHASGMIVVQVNQFKDTIYTMPDYSILLPELQLQYSDSLKQIETVLTPEMKTFFSRNLAEEFTMRADSVSPDRIFINGKAIFGLKREGFEKKIGQFQLARTDSLFGPGVAIRREFGINNIWMMFDGPKDRISSLRAVKIDHEFEQPYDFDVDGFKLGDPEEKLYERYPNATRMRNWGAPLNDITNNYYYTVELANTEGYILFYIRNGVINTVEISFLDEN